MSLDLLNKIAQILIPSLRDKGYDLVQVQMVKHGKKQVLSIDIDRFDNLPVSLDDCIAANHLISTILDVEDLIEGAYNLEISSPGEFRPLTKIEDYDRFCGQVVRLELNSPIDGKYKISGELKGVKQIADKVCVCVVENGDDKNIESLVPFDSIKKASIKREF